MQKVKKYGARDMESMSIPYILQCTIQYKALCHAIKFWSVCCVGLMPWRAGDRLWSCCNWSIHSFSRPIRSLHFCYERINFQLRILSTSSIRNQYTNKNGLLDLCWCKCCTPLSQYRVPTTFPQSDLLIIIVSINIKQWMKCLQILAF